MVEVVLAEVFCSVFCEVLWCDGIFGFHGSLTWWKMLTTNYRLRFVSEHVGKMKGEEMYLFFVDDAGGPDALDFCT